MNAAPGTDRRSRRWRSGRRGSAPRSAGSWCRASRRRRWCRWRACGRSPGCSIWGSAIRPSRTISPPMMPVIAAMNTAATSGLTATAAGQAAGEHAHRVVEVVRHPRAVQDRGHQHEHRHGDEHVLADEAVDPARHQRQAGRPQPEQRAADREGHGDPGERHAHQHQGDHHHDDQDGDGLDAHGSDVSRSAGGARPAPPHGGDATAEPATAARSAARRWRSAA